MHLLDAGLLEDAHTLASFFPVTTDIRDDGDTGEAPREAAAAAIAPERAAEYVIRLNEFVKNKLKRAEKRGIGKDEYKDGLVYQERKQVLGGVLKTGGRPWNRRCARCLA